MVKRSAHTTPALHKSTAIKANQDSNEEKLTTGAPILDRAE